MKKITQPTKLKALVFLFALIGWMDGAAQTQTFDTAGLTSFTVPAGVYSITVEAWGAGGHGADRSTNGRGGGGGGGAYAAKTLAVTPFSNFDLYVGNGAAGGSAGEDSWFGGATNVMAKGGSSASTNSSWGGNGGSATASYGTIKYSGGDGANAGYNYSGGGGSSAASNQSGNDSNSYQGATASGNGGNGGNGRYNSTGDGSNGAVPGGGGGGAYRQGGSTKNGGDGASGRIIVSWTIQDINVRGNSVNITDGDTSPSSADFTDFGSIGISAGAITRNFSIQNTGNATLNIGAITITGADSADFTVTVLPASTLAAGASTSFNISFNPSTVGTKNATLNIASDDPDENPYDFSIRGIATDPDMSVSGNSNLIVDGDATPAVTDNTDFGTTDVTSGTIVKTFVISNGLLGGNLSIGAITFTGANAADFSVTTAPASTVAAGGTTSFSVTFNPGAIGLRSAMINIANDDTDNNPYNFNIQGTGADPEIDVRGNGISIADGDTTPSATDGTNFGSVNVVGNTSTTQTFVIYNTSAATMALSVGAITFTGTNASDFSVTTAPASSVPVNGSTSFVVTFNPGATGTRSAILNIANNDSNENPYNFNIQGTGTDPEINLLGNSVSIADGDTTPSATDWTDFGSTSVISGTIVRTYTITNLSPSTANLILGTITLSGTNAGDFSVTQPASTNLAVGTSTTFTVTFDPSATGMRNATVNIPNNDSNENPYDFAIRGFGNDPEINIVGNGISIVDGDTTPSTVDNTDFGTTSIDAGSTLVTFTIQNTGVGDLNLGAIAFTGAGASFYSIVSTPPAAIAQGASGSFTVSFAPTTIGVKTATIMIINDDSNENPYNFVITGLGVRTYPDTDGDGISDNIDIDDDNDGILDTMEETNCSMSLLASSVEHVFLNETFGAGTTKGRINVNIPGATCTYCFEDGIVQANTPECPSQSSTILDDGEYVVTHRIANTTYGHPDNIHYDLAWNGYEDHTPGDTYGRMAVFNASYEPGVFYETSVNGIIPNVPITYSFWAMNILSASVYSGSILPNITVQFLDMSNNIISTYNTGNIGRCNAGNADNNCVASEWRQYTTSVNLGTNTSFIIRFLNNAPGGGGNDLALDDIVIKQQYCDRDSDSISNIYDLDSDNDGIPDIEEAGFGYLSGGKAFMDITTPGVWVDANANGLHDAVDALITAGTYVLPDTDGDGTRDFQDLDSDNDSLFDVDEAGLTNGDGDINGDGLGDGTDTDQDGILDIFDLFNGYGTQVRPLAVNTDGIGLPDYRQVDSDNDGIKDIATGLYASLDANNDGIIDGSGDLDRDGITDVFDTNTSVLGSPRSLERKLFLEFDGRNDYAEGSQLLSSLPKATIMGWIKLANGYATDGVVLGQENMYLRVTAAGQLRLAAKGTTLAYSTALVANRWYHIAGVYDGTSSTEKLKLFVNGQQVSSSTAAGLAGTLNSSTSKFTIGRFATSSALFFNGGVDEVRAFNTALTTDQLQKMVYQEIKVNGAAIRGEFIPKDIETSSWSSLLAYYRMDNYKDNVIDNHTTAAIDAGSSSSLARIYNIKNIRYQLAPMPFTTSQPGFIDTAVSQNNFVNGTDAITYPWSIIHVKHNINFNQNQTSLGMVINPGTTVNLINNNKLENSWYLKLDGKLDLQDKAQLVQTQFSDLDPSSSGFVEKDQQGSPNKFNYNYWASPVGAINSSSNNNSYTVNGVLRDGTNPANPLNLQWTSGYNSAATTPITLSSAWIYKFQNTSNSYANWSYVGQNGALTAGQGFTMKGSNALTESQNYTFVGKPYNGQIQLPIAANNLNLTGNPYTSALDANAFITVNLSVLNGSLHFWEQFSTNNSHITAQYQGGYATYTLVGGTPPVAHPDGSGLGSSSKTPKRFIPVGQGFFVTANATGGNITFDNTQRAFIKEDNAQSGTIFRPANAVNSFSSTNAALNNADDAYEMEEYARIRVGYTFTNGIHRQLLLGFMDDLATAGFDAGFDADNYDDNPDEMVFLIGTHKAVIQGDGYFNEYNSYPLEVKSAAAGDVKFTLDGTENFDDGQPIFIYDSMTGLYHNLREQDFTLQIAAGTVPDRFFLRFTESSLGIDQHSLSDGITVAYDVQTAVLGIRNKIEGVTANTATLVNMLGQSIQSFDIANQEQANIRIPLRNISSGTYIVKIETTGGIMSQKVIIK